MHLTGVTDKDTSTYWITSRISHPCAVCTMSNAQLENNIRTTQGMKQGTEMRCYPCFKSDE